jgi:exopolysaccharide biosynthesis protein
MKLINKILKKFGYVHESKTQQDLDYVLHLFNIESLDELKVKSAAFAELVEVLHKPNKLKIATLDTKKKCTTVKFLACKIRLMK